MLRKELLEDHLEPNTETVIVFVIEYIFNLDITNGDFKAGINTFLKDLS